MIVGNTAIPYKLVEESKTESLQVSKMIRGVDVPTINHSVEITEKTPSQILLDPSLIGIEQRTDG